MIELTRRLRRVRNRIMGRDYAKAEVLQPSRKRIRQYRKHLQVGDRVLEIGTGSGVLAEMALAKGATDVVAVDINPAAVAAAGRRVSRATVIQSDLFEHVEGVFSTIIFASPWSEGEVRTRFQHAIFDTGVVDRFFAAAASHLSPGGRLWVQYSDESEVNFSRFQESIERHGWSTEESWSYQHRSVLVRRKVGIFLFKIRRADDDAAGPERRPT